MALSESVLQCGFSGIVFAPTWTKNQSDYFEDMAAMAIDGGSVVDSWWKPVSSMLRNNKTLPRNRLKRFDTNFTV